LKAQSRFAVAHIGLAEVEAGVEQLANAMRAALTQDACLLAVDAATQQDLLNIVRAANATGADGLLVGSGGLAGAMAADMADRELKKPRLLDIGHIDSGNSGPVLVLAGSYSVVTRRQVELAVEQGAYLIGLALEQILDGDSEEAIRAAATAVAEFLPAGRGVVLVPVGQMRLGAELQVARAMAAVASQVLAQTPLSGLVLTGGDIAMAGCRALGANSIVVDGEIAPGLPVGRLKGGSKAGLRVVTKAGAFGEDDALHVAIKYLSQAPIGV
jgi:uncharacterized protein YgbK (DUF1537 family)